MTGTTKPPSHRRRAELTEAGIDALAERTAYEERIAHDEQAPAMAPAEDGDVLAKFARLKAELAAVPVADPRLCIISTSFSAPEEGEPSWPRAYFTLEGSVDGEHFEPMNAVEFPCPDCHSLRCECNEHDHMPGKL